MIHEYRPEMTVAAAREAHPKGMIIRSTEYCLLVFDRQQEAINHHTTPKPQVVA